MPYIDFQELKSRVSIEQAIQLLGLRLKPSYDQLRGPCPTCKFGGDRVLAVSPSKSMFYCHAGLTGGDQIALVAHVKALETYQAAAFLDRTSPARRTERPAATQKHHWLAVVKLATKSEPDNVRNLAKVSRKLRSWTERLLKRDCRAAVMVRPYPSQYAVA
jgi:hypothetical protein